MSKKRDTFTYDLKVGRKVVYKGTTNDSERRESDHKSEGKKFSHLVKTSRSMTQEGAKKKESQALETYRESHKGKNPKYNKSDSG